MIGEVLPNLDLPLAKVCKHWVIIAAGWIVSLSYIQSEGSGGAVSSLGLLHSEGVC